MTPSPIAIRAILAAASEVEAAEQRIRAAIRAAAGAGDTARIIDILARWDSMPACEVLDQNSEKTA